MYTEKVMDHFMHPRNVGEIENASGVGTVGNDKCGDIMRIYLDIDENQVVRDAKFKTFGCGAAIATSSMATEMIIGKTVQEALEVTNKAVMEALGGLPPVKVHCSLLAEQAVHAALWDYAQKNHLTIEGLKPPVNDVDELHEDYIKPQENGSHWNTRDLAVFDAHAALRVTGEGFSFNASHYTQEELTAKKHNYELEKIKETVLCIDFAHAGVGSNSCGPKLLPQYHVPGEMDFHCTLAL